MNRWTRPQLLTVAPLFGLALLLAGCPKVPILAPAASTGATGGSQATVAGSESAGGQSAAESRAAEGAIVAEKAVTETAEGAVVMTGTAIGAGRGQAAGAAVPARYDSAYEQWMYAKGNQIPAAVPPPQAIYRAAPPSVPVAS